VSETAEEQLESPTRDNKRQASETAEEQIQSPTQDNRPLTGEKLI
jgi:hypothetical protein